MATEILDGVYWINKCRTVNDQHLHVSVYLIEENNRYILIDAGAYDENTIVEEVNSLTDGEGVDTVLFTHTSLPHTGKASEFHERDANIITSTSLPAEMGMKYGEEWLIDEQPEIHGREFAFLKPIYSDHIFSQWIFDKKQSILFPSETFGNYHSYEHCGAVWDGPEFEIAEEDINRYCRDRLSGMQYIIPERLESTLTSKLDEFDIEYIAPSHGNPIAAKHIDEFVARFVEVAADISNDWIYTKMNE